jgi:hypothetical protein
MLHEPWPGVLIALPPGGVPTWLQLLTAATLRGGVASHLSAARLHGLDGCENAPALAVSTAVQVPRMDGVVRHRVAALDRCDQVTIGGVRCTGRARTLVDLGSTSDPVVLERAFDDAIRKGTNPRWLRATAERLRRPGQSGPLRLLWLIDRFEERGTVRGSWFEYLVEACLGHPELALLEQQHELRDDDGRLVARFDLALPDAKLGIEAHSKLHHYGAELEAGDEHRDHRASLLGWDVMYLGYASVQSPTTVRGMVLDRARVRRELLGRRSCP